MMRRIDRILRLPFLALILAGASAAIGAVPQALSATSVSQADCIFNWAERTYPSLFAPAGAPSLNQAPYYYRYYPAYDAYLGASAEDNHLYYVGPLSSGALRDVGAVETWASTANCQSASTPGGQAGAFTGNIALGSPTLNSIRLSALSPDQGGTVYIAYGTTPGAYDRQTVPATLSAGEPAVLDVGGLAADTRYYYQLLYRATDGSGFSPTGEYSFHTARPAGSTFSFTIQADSHLDENSSLDLYHRTLANVLADGPDFHVDLGDTFMCEKYAAPLTAVAQAAPDEATVSARYSYERTNFGLATHSAPLFLVNGNHDGELGWLNNGTAQNIAVWTTNARQKYFPTPLPDGFYSGDSINQPFVGERASWYAWHWGDALFVVLDPFWDTKTKTNTDGWVYTLGDRQYQWLQDTLSSSTAKFRFVFIHNLVGGLDGQMRGGIEAAPYFEWGGRNLDGSPGFAQKRPGWSMPIHQLLVQYGVTAVFHGHDHLYARQELDGIVYQEVPQPSAKNFQSGATLARDYHYGSGTILSSSGHLRVTVAPDRVTAQYVRSWLPANENAQRKNGQIDDTWSVGAR